MEFETLNNSNASALEKRPARQAEAASGAVSFDQHVLACKRQHPYYGFVPVRITDCPEFVMLAANDDPIALRYFWCGDDSWEPASLAVWLRLLRACRGTVLDIGSFSGLYSLATCAASDLPCVAFEPSMLPFARLVENVRANAMAGRVQVVPVALSSEEGVATFDVHREMNTLSTGGTLEIKPGRAGGGIPVRTLSLDAAVKEFSVESVGLMKVDVEGHELQFLAGAMEVLRRDRPVMLIEMKKSNVAAAVALLAKIDMNVFWIDEEARVARPVSDGLASNNENYLVVHKSSAIDMTSLLAEPAADARSAASKPA